VKPEKAKLLGALGSVVSTRTTVAARAVFPTLSVPVSV